MATKTKSEKLKIPIIRCEQREESKEKRKKLEKIREIRGYKNSVNLCDSSVNLCEIIKYVSKKLKIKT